MVTKKHSTAPNPKNISQLEGLRRIGKTKIEEREMDTIINTSNNKHDDIYRQSLPHAKTT
jgi:hypothetical protein